MDMAVKEINVAPTVVFVMTVHIVWSQPLHLKLVPRSRIVGAIPPFPQYVFMAWWLVKHWDNSTFYLYLYTTIVSVCSSTAD
jgi:hypothetical protein